MIATTVWAVLTVICKWLPHTANYSPEIAMTVYLASRYSFLKAGLLTVAIVEIADLGLALLYGYPAFGLWSVVNAVTLLLIVAIFAGSSSRIRWFNCIAKVFCASLFYWLLTNLGVWLCAEYYPMTAQGLIVCYNMALPFLPAQLLSGIVFGALWVIGEYILNALEDANLTVGADPCVRPENSAKFDLVRAGTGACPYDPSRPYAVNSISKEIPVPVIASECEAIQEILGNENERHV